MQKQPHNPEDRVWARIAEIPRRGATLAEWRCAGLGDGAVRAFLRQTGKRATRLFCPNCGYRHRVEQLSTGLSGVSVLSSSICGDIVIENPDDLLLWDLDLRIFFDSVRTVLGLHKGGVEVDSEQVIGWHTGSGIPVLWNKPYDDTRLAVTLSEIKGKWSCGAVVLLPSHSMFGKVSRAVVEGSFVVVEGCDSVLEIGETGDLTALVTGAELVAPVLAWRADKVEEIRSGMGESLSLLKGLELNVHTLGEKTDFIQEHVRGVPRVLADLREAQVDPKSQALDLYRKFKNVLSDDEIQIYDAVQRAGSNKGALPELKEKGLVNSEPTLSREMRKIKEKLGEVEGVVLSGVGPDQRYTQAKEYSDTDKKPNLVTVDSKQDALSKWAEDVDGSVEIIRQYLAAAPEEQEFYQQHYPDIQAEADEWKRGNRKNAGKQGRMKSK